MNSTVTLRVAPAYDSPSEGKNQQNGLFSKFGKAGWLVVLLLLSLHAGSFAQGRAAARQSLPRTTKVPQLIALAQPAPPAPTTTVVSLIAVRGRVVDEDGDPLVGATVLIKGSQLATATDAEGYYSLAVVAGDYTFCYGSAGYYNEEVPVRTAAADLTITLKYRPNAFKRIKRK